MQPANEELKSPTAYLWGAIAASFTGLISLANCFIAMLGEQLMHRGYIWISLVVMLVTVSCAIAWWVRYLRAYIDFRIAETLAPKARIEQEATSLAR